MTTVHSAAGLLTITCSSAVQLKALMKVLERPYEEQPGAERFKVTPPKEIRMGVELLSCSS